MLERAPVYDRGEMDGPDVQKHVAYGAVSNEAITVLGDTNLGRQIPAMDRQIRLVLARRYTDCCAAGSRMIELGSELSGKAATHYQIKLLYDASRVALPDSLRVNSWFELEYPHQLSMSGSPISSSIAIQVTGRRPAARRSRNSSIPEPYQYHPARCVLIRLQHAKTRSSPSPGQFRGKTMTVIRNVDGRPKSRPAVRVPPPLGSLLPANRHFGPLRPRFEPGTSLHRRG